MERSNIIGSLHYIIRLLLSGAFKHVLKPIQNIARQNLNGANVSVLG